jgi:dCMP deaminase
MPKYVRPSWDEYFMNLAVEVGKRGTCDRGRCGSIIVKEKRIMTTGYVGSPIGIEHCDEIGHEMKTMMNEDGSASKHCVRTAHAEQNAICQAARYGISINGATIYTKMEPCYTCAKMIINSGIKRVVCERRYHAAKESREIFKKAGVQVEVLNDEVMTYKDMK